MYFQMNDCRDLNYKNPFAIGAQEALDKIQHLFTIKTLTSVRGDIS